MLTALEAHARAGASNLRMAIQMVDSARATLARLEWRRSGERSGGSAKS
jgi:hypothetical protein